MISSHFQVKRCPCWLFCLAVEFLFGRCWLLSSLIWRLPTRAFVMLVGWKSSFQSELSLQPNSTVGFYKQLFRKIVFLMICELLVALSLWYDFTTLHMPSPQTDGGDWSSYHFFWSKAVVFNDMDSPYFFFRKTLMNLIHLMNHRMDTMAVSQLPRRQNFISGNSWSSMIGSMEGGGVETDGCEFPDDLLCIYIYHIYMMHVYIRIYVCRYLYLHMHIGKSLYIHYMYIYVLCLQKG